MASATVTLRVSPKELSIIEAALETYSRHMTALCTRDREVEVLPVVPGSDARKCKAVACELIRSIGSKIK